MFKIEEITIENFRSILYSHISTNQLNIFVGNNDAGKSNVLKALNLFFNGETDYGIDINFDNDFSKLAKKKNRRASEITIKIKMSLPDSYTDKQVIWTKKWRSESEGIKPHSDEKKVPGKKRLAQFTNSFINRISYRYIPTIKSESYFQYLLRELYESLSKNTDDELSESIKELNDKIQRQTQSISNNIKINIGLESKLVVEFIEFFRMLQFQTSIDSNSEVNLKQRGDGIRTRHIPIILNFIYENTIKNLPKRSIQLNTIWGYEEPETAIELSNCFDFAQEFLYYSNRIPMFITTHSPAFYSLPDKDTKASRYFTVNDGNGTSFSNDDINEVHEKMGLLTLITPFIKQKAEELSVIKKSLEELQKNNVPVVFLEGRTDEKYFNKALEVFGCADVPFRFNWIGHLNDKGQEENTGKDALNKAVHFLISMNLTQKCVCLFDSDTGRKESEENNVFIRVIPKFQNSKNLKVGIENALILDDVDLSSFYIERETEGNYGEIKKIQEFNKMKCCDEICEMDFNALKKVFHNLKLEIDKLIEIVDSNELVGGKSFSIALDDIIDTKETNTTSTI